MCTNWITRWLYTFSVWLVGMYSSMLPSLSANTHTSLHTFTCAHTSLHPAHRTHYLHVCACICLLRKWEPLNSTSTCVASSNGVCVQWVCAVGGGVDQPDSVVCNWGVNSHLTQWPGFCIIIFIAYTTYKHTIVLLTVFQLVNSKQLWLVETKSFNLLLSLIVTMIMCLNWSYVNKVFCIEAQLCHHT